MQNQRTKSTTRLATAGGADMEVFILEKVLWDAHDGTAPLHVVNGARWSCSGAIFATQGSPQATAKPIHRDQRTNDDV